MSGPDRQAGLHRKLSPGYRLRFRKGIGAMMRSYRLAFLALVLVAIAIAFQFSRSPATSEALPAPRAFLPDMRLQGLDGVAQDFADFRGRLAIINVWATWCAPCRAELPSLQRLRDQLDPERFVVMGISIDADRDFVREFLFDLDVRYANFHDPERKTTESLLGVRRYPQTLIVGPDGRLLQRVVGNREWDRPEVVSNIRELHR